MAPPEEKKDTPALIHPGLLQLIPAFSGDFTEATSYVEFENKFQQAAHLGSWNHQQSIAVLKMKLKGPALTLVTIDPNCQKAKADIDDFLKVLKQRYGKTVHHAQALQTLAVGIQQRADESVQSYAARVREVAKNSVPPGQDSAPFEQIAKHVFLRHLKPTIRNLAIASHPETFEDALNSAAQAEIDIQLYAIAPEAVDTEDRQIASLSTSQKNQRPFCRYCKKPGHIIQNCRKRAFRNQTFPSQGYNEFQNQPTFPSQGNNDFQQFPNFNFPGQQQNFNTAYGYPGQLSHDYFSNGFQQSGPVFRPRNQFFGNPGKPFHFQHNTQEQQPFHRPRFQPRNQFYGNRFNGGEQYRPKTSHYQEQYMTQPRQNGGPPRFQGYSNNGYYQQNGRPPFQNGYYRQQDNSNFQGNQPRNQDNQQIRFIEDLTASQEVQSKNLLAGTALNQ